MKTQYFHNCFACYFGDMVTYGDTHLEAFSRMVARVGGAVWG